jgi:hypothetical protein
LLVVQGTQVNNKRITRERERGRKRKKRIDGKLEEL